MFCPGGDWCHTRCHPLLPSVWVWLDGATLPPVSSVNYWAYARRTKTQKLKSVCPSAIVVHFGGCCGSDSRAAFWVWCVENGCTCLFRRFTRVTLFFPSPCLPLRLLDLYLQQLSPEVDTGCGFRLQRSRLLSQTAEGRSASWFTIRANRSSWIHEVVILSDMSPVAKYTPLYPIPHCNFVSA